MKYILLSICFLAFISCKFTDNFNHQDLNKLMSLYEEKDLFFVNVLVIRAGVKLYEGGAGYQNLEKKIKNNPNTIFMIGSITKTYTATILMQLVEEGKIKLEDKLSIYFPDIPNAGQISIEMLLRHRSGLFNFTSDPKFIEEVPHPISKAEFLNRFKSLQVNFPPDSKFEYSNTNYMLLGYIIESVTKDTFQNQLQKRILDKLNLKNTFLGRSSQTDHVALSYTPDNTSWKRTSPEWNTDWAAAAGAITATAGDVALFYEGLFEGKLVSKSSLELMKKQQDGYGFGMVIIPYGDKYFYGHSGSIERFQSVAGYNPVDKTTFVQMVNGSRNQNPNDISIQTLNATYGKPVEQPDLTVKPAVALPITLLEQYVGTYRSDQFPLEIKLFVNDTTLFGQATGQGAFPLKATSETDFVFEEAQIKMQMFKKGEQPAFHFQQGNVKVDFVKKVD
jgi:D-alanyl-D-alanine carboxypeptidase